MRYQLHHMDYLPSHEQYYARSFTWDLWQIISLILGLLLLCFLIGICINCFRSTAYGVTGMAPVGGVYI